MKDVFKAEKHIIWIKDKKAVCDIQLASDCHEEVAKRLVKMFIHSQKIIKICRLLGKFGIMLVPLLPLVLH